MSDAATDASGRLYPHSQLECRICWYVYDPAIGDSEQQIAAGTPFLSLPSYWRCPQCDAEPDQFLPIDV
ncbi:MAG: rubredoxin [Woeseiaceae bacterium]|nr:rubredoxin [Woeseiaceae bacterium]